MRILRALSILALLVTASVAGWSQSGTTTVTAVIKDANSSLYVNCTWSVVFVGENTTPGAGPYAPAAYTNGQQGKCDSLGNMGPIQLADNINTITPTPSQWQFNICSAPGYVPGNIICIPQTLVTITGSTQDLTSVFQPIAPLLPTGGGGGPAIALKINNSPASSQTTQNLIQGTNVTITDGGAGNITITSTGGGGGGSPGGSNTQVQINSASAFGGANCFTYNSTTQETDASNFSKIRYVTSCWNWQQSPSADLSSPGSGKTITLTCSIASPCVGIDTSATATKPYSVYISTVGTAEAALVTGGNCGLFATSNCTVVMTTVNAHAAGYTVGSAYGGIQEAMNDAASPDARIVLQPVGSNANAYQIFSPVYFQNQRSLLDAHGSFVKCFTRGPCFVLGDLVASTDVLDVRVHGLRLAAGTDIAGVAISNTSRTGCPGAGTCAINITTAAPHPFVVGDFVDIQMTNDTTYWGIWKITSSADNTHFSALVSQQVNVISSPATNIGSASSLGQVGLANAGIFDNAEGTVIDEVQFESGTAGPAPNGKFHNGIVVFNDQEAVINNPDFSTGSGFTCGSDYCANAIYAPGPFSPNAAVLAVHGREINLGCKANGITYYGGNTLSASDIVIQGFAQWSINSQNIRGGFGTTTASNVYNEVGACSNPLFSGSATASRAEVGQLGPATYRGGESPTGNAPQFDCVGAAGANTLYYWIIPKDSVLGTGAPLFAGNTASTCSGLVTTQWFRVPGTNTVTYDIVRVGLTGGGGVNGPSIGNCGGGSVLACGSVATAQPQCSSYTCTFTDDSAAATSSYSLVNPTYFPELYFWPGAAVMSPTSDTTTISNVPRMYMDHTNFLTPQSQLVSETAWMMPTYFAQECVLANPASWIACPSAGSAGLGATVMQGGASTGIPASNLKGRLNFNWDQGLPQGALITLADSCPSCTWADRTKRPSQSVSDTWIGNDKVSGGAPSTAQLTFHSPVSISNYVNTLDDGSNWLERLTATKKEMKVATQFDSNVTALGTPAGFSPFTQVNPAADNFNRADGAIGANWTVTDGTFSVSSNKAVYTFGGDAHAMAAYSAQAFNNDQCSQVIVDTMSTSLQGPMVRGSLVAETGYVFEGTTSSSNISKVVAGVVTNLVTLGPGFSDGDAVQLCVKGTTLNAYRNFAPTAVLTTTDAAIASGSPGLWARNNATGKFDFWSAQDYAWSATQKINVVDIAISGTCTGCNPGTVTASGTLTSTAVLTGAGTTVVQAPSATTTLDTSGNFSTPGSYASTASNGGISGSEGNGTGNCTPGAGVDCLWMDSTDHRWAMNNNNIGKTDVASTFPSGTVTTAGTAVTNGTCQAQTGITITGAATTDNVVANIGATLPATWQTGIQLSAHVTSANTVTVYLCNPSAGSITPAATAVIVRVLR